MDLTRDKISDLIKKIAMNIKCRSERPANKRK